jgi:hypothetical protein
MVRTGKRLFGRTGSSLPYRIAIEIDGVLANITAEPNAGLDSIQNFWESAVEAESGVVARLSDIASRRRWEIVFLANREASRGAPAQQQSQRWLESKGFTLPCVYVTSGSRGEIASALQLDLVIEARPESCENVVTESDAQTILIWPGERSALPATARRPEINIARSFGECLDMLNTVEASRPARNGWFAWIRRLFGSAA